MNKSVLIRQRNRAARLNFMRVLFGRGFISYVSLFVILTFVIAALFCKQAILLMNRIGSILWLRVLRRIGWEQIIWVVIC